MTRKKTQEEAIADFKKVHGDRYTYSAVVYVNNKTKITIRCKLHGNFKQAPTKHMSGRGCPECARKIYQTTRLLDEKSVISEFKTIHGDRYGYKDTMYKGTATKVKILCKVHGVFEQTPAKHKAGMGCPNCASNKKLTQDEVKENFKDIHGDRYSYNNVEYKNSKKPVEITCKEHGDFPQLPNNHQQGSGCPKCNLVSSKPEQEIADYLIGLGVQLERNKYGLMENKRLEADIFIPNKKIIIEYNGLVWHSERINRDIYNIKRKTTEANKAGFKCIHVREDQYLSNPTLIKNLLSSAVGIYNNRIGARETTKREITNSEYMGICLDHLQGWRGASQKRGLFYNDILVAAIGYDSKGELIRYVVRNSWQVIGALPKLIKNEGIKFSFCDLSFFDGKSYEKAGFKLDKITAPNYCYERHGKVVSRQHMMKHKLHKRFDNFDPDLTEVENCNNNGWYRLFDAGSAKYILK